MKKKKFDDLLDVLLKTTLINHKKHKIMEATLFTLFVHSWNDETKDGNVVFNEGMLQEVGTGNCIKIKFDHSYYAELDDKEAGDPKVISNLGPLTFRDVNEYGQLKETSPHYSSEGRD